MRRRLLALLIAGLVLMLLGWLSSVGYFSDAITDAYQIGTDEVALLEDLHAAQIERRADKPTMRAVSVLAHELNPLLDALNQLADERKAHPLSIGLAYRYHRVREDVLREMRQLANLRDSIPRGKANGNSSVR
jgi:hypothetical protein